MEIKFNTNTNFRRKVLKKESSTHNTKKAKVFQNIMDEIIPINSDKESIDLSRLWKSLPQLERNLISQASQENLQKYRKIVSQIINITLKKNTKIAKMKKRSKNGELVELNVIEVIDERLQKMLSLFNSPQNSAFSMLRLLDEIRGLLMDIRY